MAQEIQGKAGAAYTSDGNLATFRLSKESAQIVGDLHGRYTESAARGQTFVATTASAGIAPGTALTATPALALVNPAGSGRYLEILKAVYSYVSGTLGVGTIWWAQGLNPAALPAETTAAVRSSTLLSGATSKVGDVAQAYSGVSLTNVPVIVRPSAFSLNPYVGTAAPLTLQPPLIEEVAGEFVLAPGAWIALEGIAGAGATPLITLAITYAIVQS